VNKGKLDMSKIDNLFENKSDGSDPIIQKISRIKNELEKSLGPGLAKRYCISQDENGIHRIHNKGYRIIMEVNNPFKIDLSPNYKDKYE